MARVLLVFLVLFGFGLGGICGQEMDFYLEIEPEKNLTNIVEHVPYALNISLVYNGSEPLVGEELYLVQITLSNKLTVSLSDYEIAFSTQDIEDSVIKTIIVTGRVIGYVDLKFHLLRPNADKLLVLVEKYLVTVVRATNVWDNAFTIVVTLLALINTINMGCGLDLRIVKESLLRPIGPIVGFFSQFTFMPLFSLGLALLLIEDELKGFGLLVMGVCPGGIGSNFWTLLLDGDVNLSITMTFISSIAAIGMMPLWIWLLSPFFLDENSNVKVPFVDLAVSLILLTIPIGIGLLIRRFARKVADFITFKFIKPFSFCVLVFVFGFGFYSSSHIFILLDWQMCVAGLSVAFAGFFFGAILAWVCRLAKPQIIAISMETALQNGNIGFILLKLSFPTPYSDIASLPPIAQILMTSCILFILYGVHKIYFRCCKPRCCPGDPTTTPDIKEIPEVKNLLMSQDSEDPFKGANIPPEFSWVKTSSLIVPNSPTSPTLPRSNPFP